MANTIQRSTAGLWASVAGLAIALSACSSDFTGPTETSVSPAAPSAAAGLDPSPGTLRETFGTGISVTAGRDNRIDVCTVAPCATVASFTDAYVLTTKNPRWTDPIASTLWIGPAANSNDFNSIPHTSDTYQTTFNIPSGASAPVLNLQLWADNAATVYVNDVQIGQQTQIDAYANYGCMGTDPVYCIDPAHPAIPYSYLSTPFGFTTTGNSTLIPWHIGGSNTLKVVVLNADYIQGCENVTPGDPTCPSAAGLDYLAKVYYNTEALGTQGCTPGYWKNHAWTNLSPAYAKTDKLASVFNNTGYTTGIGQPTLQDALSFDGGSDIQGAKDILLRAAVAGLLDAAATNVAYALTSAQVISQTNTALASNDRATILALATQLDNYNNGRGGCPRN